MAFFSRTTFTPSFRELQNINFVGANYLHDAGILQPILDFNPTPFKLSLRYTDESHRKRAALENLSLPVVDYPTLRSIFKLFPNPTIRRFSFTVSSLDTSLSFRSTHYATPKLDPLWRPLGFDSNVELLSRLTFRIGDGIDTRSDVIAGTTMVGER